MSVLKARMVRFRSRFSYLACYLAPDRGISIPQLTRGHFLPLQNSRYNSLICKIQTAFDRSGKVMEGKLKLLTSESLMTSQVRSKSKCLSIWTICFCRALQPYQMEISQYNNMDRVGDTSKYHPRFTVNIERIERQDHSRSRGQGKIKLKSLCLSDVMHVLSQLSVKSAEKTPKHFLNRPTRTKIGKKWKLEK